ncbi:MAG: hypothetical protein PHJ00_08235 [Candidatus Omnitrophica bacterium]|nr:hypothetical protein [Candidatus Omnitrophota bacterium]MDD5655505.1 hypothetical protein [Candidatus Omnitrophota bacterium]
MVNRPVVVIFLFLGLVGAGCQSNETRVGEGAVIGGLLGATAGGVIGHQSHHGGEGAAIGAAAGILGGALVGSQINKNKQGTQAGGSATAPNPNQMSIQQIVDLSKQGVNEAVIIDKIHLTNSKFTLGAADVDSLKQQGVSQAVIEAMQGLR